MRKKIVFFNPIIIPVYFFALLILTGTLLLYAPFSQSGQAEPLAFIDAFFIATSSACVTGLATVDISLIFNHVGHTVMMFLIQIGGLGIMTFSSLMFYLWRRRTSLSDLMAVGRGLRSDQSFSLGRFLIAMFLMVFSLEIIGALILYIAHPEEIGLFGSFFLAVSAFCNAGFALFPDNLMRFRADPAVNLVVMSLIVFGGLGFAVLLEIHDRLGGLLKGQRWRRLQWSTNVVLYSTGFLIVVGAAVLYIGALHRDDAAAMGWAERIWASFFQSVTCRTAGFNTVPIDKASDFSLAFMCLLMFIGAAPGSTGGGIKVTTARALLARVVAMVKGHSQARIGRRAVDSVTLQSALTLLLLCGALVFFSTLLLCVSEGGLMPHNETNGRFLEALYEVVSAFATVGLTAGLTPKLSLFGKCLISVLMFVGRLGPLVLLAAMNEVARPQLYKLPEDSLMIG